MIFKFALTCRQWPNVFARCENKNTHGHARIARETRAKKCDTNHNLGPLPTYLDLPGYIKIFKIIGHLD